jgi:hypothetical protein
MVGMLLGRWAEDALRHSMLGLVVTRGTSRGLDAPATSARDEMSQYFELASERFQAHGLALAGYAQLGNIAPRDFINA